ncbi:MAG: AbrB/MazE/SpoVT family DNA-binding domain-containing protein [Anaerolineae bacterium]|nr:AbrB/MazE/SpoVT family DNA-binding domain-containing protein [Anaerolineae bacterium]
MAERASVGPELGIATPPDAGRRLSIEAGDHVLVEIRDGYLVVIPAPEDCAARLRGLHRDVWVAEDP